MEQFVLPPVENSYAGDAKHNGVVNCILFPFHLPKLLIPRDNRFRSRPAPAMGTLRFTTDASVTNFHIGLACRANHLGFSSIAFWFAIGQWSALRVCVRGKPKEKRKPRKSELRPQ
jgi:hypothetical protein